MPWLTSVLVNQLLRRRIALLQERVEDAYSRHNQLMNVACHCPAGAGTTGGSDSAASAASSAALRTLFPYEASGVALQTALLGAGWLTLCGIRHVRRLQQDNVQATKGRVRLHGMGVPFGSLPWDVRVMHRPLAWPALPCPDAPVPVGALAAAQADLACREAEVAALTAAQADLAKVCWASRPAPHGQLATRMYAPCAGALGSCASDHHPSYLG